MPAKVFLDTSGWLALLHAKDINHEQANTIWLELGASKRDVVLTDWIIAETGNGLARTRIRHLFATAADRVLNSRKVEVVAVELDLMMKAIELYGRHTDKSWGLVDCASFVVMQERGISEAFTSDRHFEQAGFQCLLSA